MLEVRGDEFKGERWKSIVNLVLSGAAFGERGIVVIFIVYYVLPVP